MAENAPLHKALNCLGMIQILLKAYQPPKESITAQNPFLPSKAHPIAYKYSEHITT